MISKCNKFVFIIHFSDVRINFCSSKSTSVECVEVNLYVLLKKDLWKWKKGSRMTARFFCDEFDNGNSDCVELFPIQ